MTDAGQIVPTVFISPRRQERQMDIKGHSEPPEAPEIRIDTMARTAEEAADLIVERLIA